MQKIIIDMYNGILDAVYSNVPCEMEVRMIDYDDKNDLERLKEYWRNKWLINRDCYFGIYNDNSSNTESKEGELILRKSMDKADRDSIIESMPGEKKDKLESVAYIDGFLAAWGYLMRMLRKKRIYEKSDESLAEQVAQRFEEIYDVLCDELWKEEPAESKEK
uniref:hypothetical protein n=1 Tax=Candidatus Fimivicinus sp. TaxID=3056640 RepID=UPI00402794C3